MKYLKTYENIKKYKVGDYVLMSGKNYVNKNDKPIKITRLLDWGDPVFIFSDGTESVTTHKDIIRYLTPEEIIEFDTKINTKKYNL